MKQRKFQSDKLIGISGIAFDKDGTLVDYMSTWSSTIPKVLKYFSGESEQTFKQLAAVSGYDVSNNRVLPGAPIVTRKVEEYLLRWSKILHESPTSMLAERITSKLMETCRENLVPIGRPYEILNKLNEAGIPIGLVTNDSKANTFLQLKQLDLLDFFSFIATRDSGYGKKPSMEGIKAFASSLKIPLNSVAFVGDSIEDMCAARNCGAWAIAVPTGFTTYSDLNQFADLVCCDLQEVLIALGF